MEQFDLMAAMDYIVKHDDECRVILYLTQALNQKAINRLYKYREARSGLTAIGKINAGKDSAIDALCEQTTVLPQFDYNDYDVMR